MRSGWKAGERGFTRPKSHAPTGADHGVDENPFLTLIEGFEHDAQIGGGYVIDAGDLGGVSRIS
jgi:hypothetical protein